MRRKEREVTDIEEIKQILAEGEVLHIALNDGVYPYILPVNYGFTMQDGALTIFFHGAKEGTKNQLIARDPHVSFEVDCRHQLVPPKGTEACTASYGYASVIGQGIVEKAADAEKEEYLTEILAHYGIRTMEFHPARVANTAVYKIVVKNYTAKCRKTDE